MTIAIQRLPAPTQAGQRATVLDALAFALGVVVVLIYSQAWVWPLMGEATPSESSSALLRSLYYPAYAAALALGMGAFWETIRGAARSPLLLALVLLAAASIVWSVEPELTTRRVVALSFTTMAGVVLASRFGWAALTEMFATGYAVLAIGSAIVGLLMPSVGRMEDIFPGSWRGLWSEKNAFGAHMAFATSIFLAAAVLRPRRRLLWAGFALLAAALVVLSTSKTSLLSLTLGLAALGFVGLVRRGPAAGVGATWAAVAGAGLLALGALLAADSLFALLGKDATLTGRTVLWEAIGRQIEQRPWFGHGYSAVWDNAGTWSPRQWIARDADFLAVHAHNSWLEVWLALGLLGLAVWAMLFVEVWARALVGVHRDGPAEPGGYVVLPFLAIFSLMTLTESVAVVYHDVNWVLFTAFAVKLAAGARR